MRSSMILSPYLIVPSAFVVCGVVVGLVLWLFVVNSSGEIVAVPDPTYPPSGAGLQPPPPSFAELVDRADIIFSGTVTSVGGFHNGARVEGNPHEPDPEAYQVKREYNVAVETGLKGTPSREVVVFQYEGSFSQDKMSPSEWDQRTFSLAYPRLVPLEVGATYTFFLRQSSWDTSVWGPAAEPYRYKHVADGRAFPQGTFSDSGKSFEILTPQALHDKVRQEVARP